MNFNKTNIRRHFTQSKFLAWYHIQKLDNVYFAAKNCELCPIAQYLKSIFPAEEVISVTPAVFYILNHRKLLVYHKMPRWATKFIEEFDKLNA